jgi:hypothetical protein
MSLSKCVILRTNSMSDDTLDIMGVAEDESHGPSYVLIVFDDASGSFTHAYIVINKSAYLVARWQSGEVTPAVLYGQLCGRQLSPIGTPLKVHSFIKPPIKSGVLQGKIAEEASLLLIEYAMTSWKWTDLSRRPHGGPHL